MQAGRIMRTATIAVALLSPAASHLALALGQGYGAALALAAAQALAAGLVLAASLPRHRWLGVVATLLLLSGLVLGAKHSPAAGLLVAAGLSHAIVYAVLLAVFARSLRPGYQALVTGLARRLNPRFHAGMVPYTRAVTRAWCLFFAAQLLLSATLLATAPAAWGLFVTTLHAPLVLAMAVAEFLVRRWRWRHEHTTGLRATIAGMRHVTAAAAGARTSRPAADCPAHSGSATRPPGRAADSGPGPAG